MFDRLLVRYGGTKEHNLASAGRPLSRGQCYKEDSWIATHHRAGVRGFRARQSAGSSEMPIQIPRRAWRAEAPNKNRGSSGQTSIGRHPAVVLIMFGLVWFGLVWFGPF
jgi:hypothetical protein